MSIGTETPGFRSLRPIDGYSGVHGPPGRCRPAMTPAIPGVTVPPSRPSARPGGRHPPPQDRQRKYVRSTSTRPSRLEARTSAPSGAGPSACRRPRTPAPAASRPAARKMLQGGCAAAPSSGRPSRQSTASGWRCPLFPALLAMAPAPVSCLNARRQPIPPGTSPARLPGQ